MRSQSSLDSGGAEAQSQPGTQAKSSREPDPDLDGKSGSEHDLGVAEWMPGIRDPVWGVEGQTSLETQAEATETHQTPIDLGARLYNTSSDVYYQPRVPVYRDASIQQEYTMTYMEHEETSSTEFSQSLYPGYTPTESSIQPQKSNAQLDYPQNRSRETHMPVPSERAPLITQTSADQEVQAITAQGFEVELPTRSTQSPESSEFRDSSAVNMVFAAVQPPYSSSSTSLYSSATEGPTSYETAESRSISSGQYYSAQSDLESDASKQPDSRSWSSAQFYSASSDLDSESTPIPGTRTHYHSVPESLDSDTSKQTQTISTDISEDRAIERVQVPGPRSHETFHEPCIDREEDIMVVEDPITDRQEEYLVESPRSTCTPSAVTPHTQMFTFPVLSSDQHEAAVVPSSSTQAHSVPPEFQVDFFSIEPQVKEACAKEPIKKQLSDEDKEFIKAAQFEIDALVISLDTVSDSVSENTDAYSEYSESESSVDLDIRQRRELGDRRQSVKPFTEINLRPNFSAERLRILDFSDESHEGSREITPPKQQEQPPVQSTLVLPIQQTPHADRPRSPWHHQEQVSIPAEIQPAMSAVSVETSSTVSESMVSYIEPEIQPEESAVVHSGPAIGLPVQISIESQDDAELTAAFEKPESEKSSLEPEPELLTLKPQWMVRPSSPWARDNLERQISRDSAKDEAEAESRQAIKPRSPKRESPKLFDYSSSSSSGADQEKVHKTVEMHSTKDTVTSIKDSEMDDFIVVDPLELLHEQEIIITSSDERHTQSETFSDYSETLLDITEHGIPKAKSSDLPKCDTKLTESSAKETLPSVQLETDDYDDDLMAEITFHQEKDTMSEHKPEDDDLSAFSLKPQWLVRPSSPWSHDKLVEMSHHTFPLSPTSDSAHLSLPTTSSPKIGQQISEPTISIDVSHTDDKELPMPSIIELPGDKETESEASMSMLGSDISISTLSESSVATLTASKEELHDDQSGSSDYDADIDEERSSGSEMFQSPDAFKSPDATAHEDQLTLEHEEALEQALQNVVMEAELPQNVTSILPSVPEDAILECPDDGDLERLESPCSELSVHSSSDEGEVTIIDASDLILSIPEGEEEDEEDILFEEDVWEESTKPQQTEQEQELVVNKPEAPETKEAQRQVQTEARHMPEHSQDTKDIEGIQKEPSPSGSEKYVGSYTDSSSVSGPTCPIHGTRIYDSPCSTSELSETYDTGKEFLTAEGSLSEAEVQASRYETHTEQPTDIDTKHEDTMKDTLAKDDTEHSVQSAEIDLSEYDIVEEEEVEKVLATMSEGQTQQTKSDEQDVQSSGVEQVSHEDDQKAGCDTESSKDKKEK